MSAPVPEINPGQSTEYRGYQIWLGPFGDVIVALAGNHQASTPRQARHLAALICAYADASEARKTGEGP